MRLGFDDVYILRDGGRRHVRLGREPAKRAAKKERRGESESARRQGCVPKLNRVQVKQGPDLTDGGSLASNGGYATRQRSGANAPGSAFGATSKAAAWEKFPLTRKTPACRIPPISALHRARASEPSLRARQGKTEMRRHTVSTPRFRVGVESMRRPLHLGRSLDPTRGPRPHLGLCRTVPHQASVHSGTGTPEPGAVAHPLGHGLSSDGPRWDRTAGSVTALPMADRTSSQSCSTGGFTEQAMTRRASPTTSISFNTCPHKDKADNTGNWHGPDILASLACPLAVQSNQQSAQGVR